MALELGMEEFTLNKKPEEFTLKYLITGGTGFIGSEVVARLARRIAPENIVLLLRRIPSNENSLFRMRLNEHGQSEIFSSLKYVESDFLDSDRFQRSLEGLGQGPWVVIHMAAIISGLHSTPEEQERVNVGVTRDLLEWSAKVKACRFIYLSSVVAFGGIAKPRLRNEDDFAQFPAICRKLGYFRTKRDAHEQVLAHARAPTTIYCPSIVHGSLEHFKDSRGHLRALREGRLRMAPGGGGNFVSLDRVSEAIVREALESKAQASLEESASFSFKMRTQLLVDRNMTYAEYFKFYLNVYRKHQGLSPESREPTIRALPTSLGPALRILIPLAKALGLQHKLMDALLESSLFLFFESKYELPASEGLEAALLKSFAP
jgi:nucleoside-diphosphate-sugar epimerase